MKRENVCKAKELKTKALKTLRTVSFWANSTILLPGKSMICMNFLLDKKTNCLPSAWNLGEARRWGNYCANYACLSLSAFFMLFSHFCLIFSLHLYLNFVYANIICSLYLYIKIRVLVCNILRSARIICWLDALMDSEVQCVQDVGALSK